MKKEIKEELSKEREIMFDRIRHALKDFTDETGVMVTDVRWDVTGIVRLGTRERCVEYYGFESELKVY